MPASNSSVDEDQGSESLVVDGDSPDDIDIQDDGVDDEEGNEDSNAVAGSTPWFFNRKKLALIFIALIILYILTTFVEVWFAANYHQKKTGEAAVVLGAAQYNGEPSPVLQGRLDRAAELYESEDVNLVVVTGGGQQGDITTEANAGYRYLRRTAGLPDEDLRLEVQGGSTYESLAATARFLEEEEISEIVLVTDPFHAKRAELIAEEVGLSVGVATTSAPASLERLVKETGAVALGRVVGFRRLERL